MPVKTRYWFFQKVSDLPLLLFDALKYSEIQFRLYIIVSVVYSYVVCIGKSLTDVVVYIFCSLACELTHRRRYRMHKLNSNAERVG